MSLFRAIAAWLLLVPLATPSGVSYRSLTAPEEAREFFATGGRAWRFERVHIHLPASVLHAEPMKVVPTKNGGKCLLYRNRSVPLVVDPGNVYVRKIRQRTAHGDTICVKGTVNREPLGGKDRYALFVHTVKKHG
jgi:hypothetical protein